MGAQLWVQPQSIAASDESNTRMTHAPFPRHKFFVSYLCCDTVHLKTIDLPTFQIFPDAADAALSFFPHMIFCVTGMTGSVLPRVQSNPRL